VVTEPDDRRREWERERVETNLRQISAALAANLLRVVRGAGRSHEVAQHAAAYLAS
jgi:hypothetical protein